MTCEKEYRVTLVVGPLLPFNMHSLDPPLNDNNVFTLLQLKSMSTALANALGLIATKKAVAIRKTTE
jgi:hypothetical protein